MMQDVAGLRGSIPLHGTIFLFVFRGLGSALGFRLIVDGCRTCMELPAILGEALGEDV